MEEVKDENNEVKQKTEATQNENSVQEEVSCKKKSSVDLCRRLSCVYRISPV